ncbi:MAG TPA: hypothetical protein P5106_09095, partial [Caldisericia bacterium]|nr:hypothetical protein [Caldisericia bacterium]
MEVNYEYIPIKYTDPHGRFFYLVYDTFGRLVEVKNDYTSRSLLFSYTIGNRLQYVIDTTPDQTEFEIIYTTRLHPETLEDIYVLSNMTIEQESFWGAVYKYTDKGEQKGFESPLEWFIMYQKENSIQYPPIPDVQYDNGVVYKVYNPVSNADGIEETLQWTYLLPHDNEYECGRESFFEGYTTRVDNWNPEQPSSVPEPKIDTVGMYRCLMYYHEPITGYLVSVYKDRDSEDPGPENCGQGGDVWLDDCCKTELVTYGYTSKGDVSNQKYLGQETGTDYTYDYEVPGSTATGQVVKVEENVGNANATRPTSEFAYSPDGTLSTSTNPAGAVTTYDYYTDKRQKSVTGQSGETRTIEYDSDGQVIKAKSPGCDEGDSDIETTIDYKTNGLVQSVTEPNGKSTSYDYDQKYRIQRIFENGNLLTEFEYDNRGRINKITQNTSGTSEQWSYQYDYKGRVSSSTYTHGTETQVTSYEYYGNDKVKKITDSNNEITEFRYNIDGKLVKVINPDSGEETWEYDRLGRVISNTSPEGVEVEYSYNDNGKLYQFTKVKGDDGTNDYTFTFEYDDLLRPTKITKPDSSYTQRTYKNETNLVSAERDELGNISEYSYDTSGRLSSSEDAEGHTLDYYYNDCGTIKQVTDGSGNSYKYEYDSAGRLNKVTDALNNSWEYTFDTDSNDLVYKTDSQNRTIQYSWNDQHLNTAIQWVQSILPESSVFNDLKLKTSFTNGQNETMSFGYDSLKRLTSITFSDLSTVSYTYDNENNMVSTMTDTHGIHNFSYDLSGRMTQYTAPYNWSVNLTFGDSGFLTQRVNNNGTYSYTYDNNSLVEFDTPELADPIEYQWRANGQIESKTIPATDDIKYEWTVNGIGQATEVTVDYGTTEKYSWDYTFDTNGRKSQIVDAQGTRNISYDAMGQVTSVVENGTSTGMAYDSTYNMTSKSVGTDNYVYNYNADDQLTMIYENGQPTTEFEYDSAGRLTSRHPPSVMTYNYRYDYYRDRNNPNIKPYSVFTSNETTYEYNDLGNLTKVVKPNDDEISFTYYGNGKRATKSVKVGLATTTWRYYYDQDLPVKIENLSDSTENVTFTFNGSRDLLTMNYKNNTYFYIINIRGDV